MPYSKDKRVTSRDVARLANVSQSTVSRVLQGTTRVKPSTRVAVMQAIEALGYSPSPAARSMRTQRTDAIALVVASLTSNQLYPALLQLLFAELNRHGLHATVWEAERFDHQTANSLLENPIDGVIIATAIDSVRPHLERVARHKPVILINRTIDSVHFDQISSDNVAGGSAVAAYFFENGRKRIGLLSAENYPASTIRHREAGFLSELSRRSVPLKADDIARVCTFSYDAGYETMRRMLSEKQYDAIFCVNDVIAIGALDALRHRGSGSEHAWVVGYDDIPVSAWRCIGLTTVRQPLPEMVVKAVAVLKRRLEGDTSPPRQVTLGNEIIFRQSTKIS